jgi:Tfp pilus assembly protein PilN
MLDLRGTQNSSQPIPKGVPNVGTSDVSFAPSAQHSSPILETGSRAPNGKNISNISEIKKDPIILVVAIVSVAIAGATGVFANYQATQQQKQLETNTRKYDTLNAQLTTGDTGKNYQLIQTTAKQLAVLTASKADTPWVSLLDAMSGQVPGAVQLTNSAFDVKTKTLTLSGNGKTYDDVAHLMAALDASDRFDQVVLKNSSLNQTGTDLKADFSITTQFVPNPPAANTNATPTTQGGTQ